MPGSFPHASIFLNAVKLDLNAIKLKLQSFGIITLLLVVTVRDFPGRKTIVARFPVEVQTPTASQQSHDSDSATWTERARQASGAFSNSAKLTTSIVTLNSATP